MRRTFSDVKVLTKREQRVALPVLGFIILLIVVFAIFPVCQLAWWSLTDKQIGSEEQIVGLSNYLRVFASRTYYVVTEQTLVYTTLSVLLKLLLGTSLALLTVKVVRDSAGRTMGGLVPVLLLPWAIPTAASMLIWSWVLYDLGGLLNSVLRFSGLISTNIAWLGSHRLATASMISVNTWRGMGFFYSSILAARLSIPDQRYFVGRIEGASSWTIFRGITLPEMLTTILVVTLISIINTYTDFQLVHILTNGGPGDSTQIFSTMIYELAFRGRSSLGYAAAFAISLLPLLILIMVILLRLISKRQGFQIV